MTTRHHSRGTSLFLAILALSFVILGTAEASALSSERFEIIAISAPGGTMHDHREYYLLMEAPPASEPKKISLLPMTEAVADTIENLREGSNTCEGKRFKNQIFELFNCIARH